MSNQKYTMVFKKQVVKFYLDHHTVKETLQEFHVPESTLFAWKQQYHKGLFDLSHAAKAMTLNRLQSHAKKLEQILICIHGSCKILLDNGKERNI